MMPVHYQNIYGHPDLDYMAPTANLQLKKCISVVQKMMFSALLCTGYLGSSAEKSSSQVDLALAYVD